MYKNKRSHLASIWQKQNWDKCLKYKLKSKQKRILANKKLVDDFKSKCIICGETDKRCLDCHHIKDKKYNIGSMIYEGYSEKLIILELQKCEVLCSNCHRQLTFKKCKYLTSIKKYVNNIKSNARCQLCGIRGMEKLDFHHLDPKNKVLNIGAMIRNKKYTLEDIKNEINKCIIICVNCHRKIHS